MTFRVPLFATLVIAAAIAAPSLAVDARAQGPRAGRALEGEILVKYKPGMAAQDRAEAREVRAGHFIPERCEWHERQEQGQEQSDAEAMVRLECRKQRGLVTAALLCVTAGRVNSYRAL